MSLLTLVLLAVFTVFWTLVVRVKYSLDKEEESYTWGRSTVAGVILAITSFLLMRTWFSSLVEKWWLEDLGYGQVWEVKTLLYWVALIATLVVTFAFLSLNEFLAYNLVGYKRKQKDALLSTTSLVLKALLSFVVTFLSLNHIWYGLLLTRSRLNFGMTDPILQMDAGWYMTQLPFQNAIANFAHNVLWVTIIFLCVIYFLYTRYSDTYSDEGVDSRRTFSHFSLLAGLVLLVWAFFAYLTVFGQIIGDSGNEVVLGAGFVDVNSTIPNLRIMAIVLSLLALGCFVNAFYRSELTAIVITGSVFVAWFVLLWICPEFVRLFQVNNNPTLEYPYLAYQIDWTREAYQLNEIEDRGLFPYSDSLTTEELIANNETLSQSRVMDWSVVLSVNNQSHERGTQFHFNDVDLLRQNGQSYMMSVRELVSNQIPAQAQTWANIHGTYTHGYGFTLVESDTSTLSGSPEYVVQGIPPVGPSEFLVERPQIYCGELTDQWIATNTNQREFDFTENEVPVYSNYQGTTGLKMDSGFSRFVMAVVLDDYNFLVSPLFTEQSKLLLWRTINERVNGIAPYLSYDGDPYAVPANGEIYWIQDAYTISNNFPYAQATGGFNYIRNSVKVVVDAYDCTVNFYASDTEDPILQMWMNTYPGVFKSMEEFPEFLRSHIRYPEGIFATRARMYGEYHVRNIDPLEEAAIFYSRQEVWVPAYENIGIGTNVGESVPRYVQMVLPHESDEEFVLLWPFTPLGKNNLAAWFAARNDMPNEGEMLVYRFPVSDIVEGPMQIGGNISEDPTLSGQISLWDQGGSRVLWGNFITLPVMGNEQGSVIYVRPLYIQSQNAQSPNLTLVIIAYNDSLFIGNSLEDTISKLYSGNDAVSQVGELGLTQPTGTFEEAYQAYQDAQSCMADQDWICFGNAMEHLGLILEANQPTPVPAQ